MPIDPVRLHGGFVELGLRVGGGEGWRVWASPRFEAGMVSGDAFVGAAGRLTAQVWAGLRGPCHGGPSGIFGVAALGLWAEAGARRLGDRDARFVSAGLELRVPLIGLHGGSGHCY